MNRRFRNLPPLAPRRGFALLLVLWFIVFVMAIAISLSYQMRVSMKMTSYSRKKLEAEGLARAGMAKAVLDLKNDRLMATADPAYNNDTGEDIWAKIEDKTEVPMGAGVYTVRIVDENSKIDLNGINPGNRKALEYLLKEVGGVGDDEAQQMTDAYLDYVDADDKALAKADQDEQDFYTNWAIGRYGADLPEDYTFRPKNEPLTSVDELLEIPGFTWKMLYGDPDKTPQDPIDRIDSREKSGALADYLTAGTMRRINVNTVSKTALEAMLSAASGGAGDVGGLASQIDSFRQSLMKMGKTGGMGILDPSQLTQSGINPGLYTTLVTMFPLSQSSSYFRIYSRGEVSGIRSTKSARVYVVVQRYPLDPDHPESWGLRDRLGFGVLKSQENFKIDPEVRVDRLSEL